MRVDAKELLARLAVFGELRGLDIERPISCALVSAAAMTRRASLRVITTLFSNGN